jgi:hypothetical protein
MRRDGLRGRARLGEEWHGRAGQGPTRRGTAGHGEAGPVEARQGVARRGKAGHGVAGHGVAWHGEANQGKDVYDLCPQRTGRRLLQNRLHRWLRGSPPRSTANRQSKTVRHSLYLSRRRNQRSGTTPPIPCVQNERRRNGMVRSIYGISRSTGDRNQWRTASRTSKSNSPDFGP